MRKFCLLICISLLSSMFHAVAMPVKTLQIPAIEAELFNPVLRTLVLQDHTNKQLKLFLQS